jgi:hypothetical protein
LSDQKPLYLLDNLRNVSEEMAGPGRYLAIQLGSSAARNRAMFG